MYRAFRYASVTITIFFLVLSARSIAADFRGEVIRADGCVHIIDAGGVRQEVGEPGVPVREMDTIVTEAGGHAVVRFTDGALSVLHERSRLRVEKTGWLSHFGGNIYFTFRKVFGEKRTIQTRFATLGIRGTTFIVFDDIEGQGVALQEGLLEIESQGPAFEIHRQQQSGEFEQFRQEMHRQQQQINQEFDDYREQLSREFIEYRSRFTLEPEHVIRFDGARVDESRFDRQVAADFENLESIAGDLLEKFREQTRQKRETMQPQQQLDEDDYYE